MGDFRESILLGRTGLRVSRLGIGSSYGVPAKAVERAFHEYGVNYLYWGSIRRKEFGRALANLSRDHRESLVVALQSYDRTAKLMRGSLERGLRKAHIDYADVLILGWWDRLPSRRVIDAALKLKAEGKVRFLAVSGHRRPMFVELLNDPRLSCVDILMIRYNAVHTGAEGEIFAHLPVTDRPGITTYTTTCWGRLLQAKRMPPGEKPLTGSDCYRFALSHLDVDLCLCGPTNERQLTDALKALDEGPLSEEEMKRIRRIGAYIHRGSASDE